MSSPSYPLTSKSSSKKRARASFGNDFKNQVEREGHRSPHIAERDAQPGQPSYRSPRELPYFQPEADSFVHECSFLRPHVPGITALAVTPDGDTMACGRNDYSILITRNFGLWTPIDEVLPRSGDPDQSVSCLQFTPCSNYLVAGRLNGTVTFWRIFDCGLALHAEIRPGGGAVWNMQFAPGCSTSCFRLAVACDDGAVRVVSPDPEFNSETLPTNEAHYVIKMMPRAQARALSVTWMDEGNVRGGEDAKDENNTTQQKIITGDSKGGLRVLCPETGKVFGQGKIPWSDGRPVLIWTVQSVCGGRKIFCGDDRGIVTIWDSASLTMSSEISPHGVRGAIWCSAVIKHRSKTKGLTDEGSRREVRYVVVFGSANGRVSAIQSEDKHGRSWSNFRGNAVHTHDVRGIVSISDEKFVTASIDSKIALGSLNWFGQAKDDKKVTWISTFNDLVGRKTVQISRVHNIVVCRGAKEIELWYIPPDESSVPKLLLRMKFESGSDLRACALSPDCQMLAVSDADSFRLYRIWDGVGSNPQTALSFGTVDLVDTTPKIEAALTGCISVSFCNRFVVAVSANRMGVVIYDAQQEVFKHYDMSEWNSKGLFLKHMACGNSTVAVMDSSNEVFISTVESTDLEWESSCKVPAPSWLSAPLRTVLAFALSPSGERIACSFPNGLFFSGGIGPKKRPHTFGFVSVDDRHQFLSSLTFGRSEKSVLASSNITSVIILLEKDSMGNSHNQFKRWKSPQQFRTYSYEPAKLDVFEVPSSRPKLLTSGIISGGRIFLVQSDIGVLQTYLPDAIPSKPNTFN